MAVFFSYATLHWVKERERERGGHSVQFQVPTAYHNGILIYCYFGFYLKLLIILVFSY